MKKLIFLISFVFLTSLIVNSQVYKIKSVSTDPGTKKQSIKKQVYYFTDLQVDESIFEKDTLILSKERTNIDPPRLVLFEDSTFILHYDINIDTIKTKDKKTGSMMATIIETSEKINGTWKTNNTETGLTLLFKDEKYIDYAVVNKNDLIYFIKLE